MQNFLEAMSKEFFGNSRKESIDNEKCVSCGKEAMKFDSPLSEREFQLSGLCQECQDNVFDVFDTTLAT